jgi:hypothetical protein
LLVVELVTGRLQLGDTTFEQFDPAQVNVAGDADDADGPTYATFAGLLGASPLATGAAVTATVDRAGTVGDNPAMGAHNVTASHFVAETNHTVASVFWDFMNSQGPVYENGGTITAPLFLNAFFATGFPITEPYWARVKVGGTVKDVLIQVFERRVMTFTPSNSGGFQVESGNVGQHYRTWRYVQIPDSQEPDIPEVGEPIGGTDFSTVGPLESPSGATGDSTANSYIITLPPMSGLAVLVDANLGDFALSLDSKLLAGSEITLSCLIFRADLDGAVPAYYDYCIFYEGPNSVVLAISYVTEADAPILAAWEFTEPPAGTEWHILGVIAQADQFWLFFDDSYVGTTEHADGPDVGLIGTAAYNVAETGDSSQVELTNLFAWNLVV